MTDTYLELQEAAAPRSRICLNCKQEWEEHEVDPLDDSRPRLCPTADNAQYLSACALYEEMSRYADLLHQKAYAMRPKVWDD